MLRVPASSISVRDAGAGAQYETAPENVRPARMSSSASPALWLPDVSLLRRGRQSDRKPERYDLGDGPLGNPENSASPVS